MFLLLVLISGVVVVVLERALHRPVCFANLLCATAVRVYVATTADGGGEIWIRDDGVRD